MGETPKPPPRRSRPRPSRAGVWPFSVADGTEVHIPPGAAIRLGRRRPAFRMLQACPDPSVPATLRQESPGAPPHADRRPPRPARELRTPVAIPRYRRPVAVPRWGRPPYPRPSRSSRGRDRRRLHARGPRAPGAPRARHRGGGHRRRLLGGRHRHGAAGDQGAPRPTRARRRHHPPLRARGRARPARPPPPRGRGTGQGRLPRRAPVLRDGSPRRASRWAPWSGAAAPSPSPRGCASPTTSSPASRPSTRRVSSTGTSSPTTSSSPPGRTGPSAPRSSTSASRRSRAWTRATG